MIKSQVKKGFDEQECLVHLGFTPDEQQFTLT
jgi:hypothetical protein